MTNAEIRRRLGCGSTGRYDMSQQTYVVRDTTPKPVAPPVAISTKAFILYGIWCIFDNGILREATHEEIKAAQYAV